MVLVGAVSFLGLMEAIGERDGERHDNILEMPSVWDGELAIQGELSVVREVGPAPDGETVNDTERIQDTLETSGGGSMWGGEPAYAASAPGDVPFVVAGPDTPPVETEQPLGVPVVEPVPAEPTPEPEPQLTGVEAAICAYPWDCYTALRVARCESTLQPDAVGAGSYGLMQIQASVHSWKWPTFWEDWMIPERNLEYAWEIYQGRGWYAWSCF